MQASLDYLSALVRQAISEIPSWNDPFWASHGIDPIAEVEELLDRHYRGTRYMPSPETLPGFGESSLPPSQVSGQFCHLDQHWANEIAYDPSYPASSPASSFETYSPSEEGSTGLDFDALLFNSPHVQDTDQHGSNALLAAPAPPTLALQQQHDTASQHHPMATHPMPSYPATPSPPCDTISDLILTEQRQYSMQPPPPPPTHRNHEEIPSPSRTPNQSQARQHNSAPTMAEGCGFSPATFMGTPQYQSMGQAGSHFQEAGSRDYTHEPAGSYQSQPSSSRIVDGNHHESAPAQTTDTRHQLAPKTTVTPRPSSRAAQRADSVSVSPPRDAERPYTKRSTPAPRADVQASSENLLIERPAQCEVNPGGRSRQEDGEEGLGHIAAQPGPSAPPSDANTRPAQASLGVQPTSPTKKGTKRRNDAIEDPADSSSSSAPRALKRARIDSTSSLPASPPSQLSPSSSSSSSSSHSPSSTPPIRPRPRPTTNKKPRYEHSLRDRIGGNMIITTDIRALEEENRQRIWVQESGF